MRRRTPVVWRGCDGSRHLNVLRLFPSDFEFSPLFQFSDWDLAIAGENELKGLLVLYPTRSLAWLKHSKFEDKSMRHYTCGKGFEPDPAFIFGMSLYSPAAGSAETGAEGGWV